MKVDNETIEKEFKKIGSIKPQPGHKCFEYNHVENTLSYAEFKEKTLDYKAAERNLPVRKKLFVKPNCYYVTALNFKNAVKKIMRETPFLNTPAKMLSISINH